ncbi:MAG: peroxidase-related enzyme, partial [Pseudomonadota bacterium]
MAKDQDNSVTALNFPPDEPMSEDTKAYFDLCAEKLGLVPNVLQAYAFNDTKLRAFTDMYNDLMLGPSTLSKAEREMIAVVVSSCNRCFYCLVAHGAALRQLTGDPKLSEMLVLNYRVAPLS